MKRPFALPGTKPRYAPDRVVDVEHYRLDLDLDHEARRVQGTCTITVTPIMGAKRLDLDAVELEIQSIGVDGGKPLRWSYDGKRLRIELGREVPAGERITLVIAYAASPRRGLYFIAPDEKYPERPRQIWTQGQDEDSRWWFPCFDAPNAKSTSEVVATVPQDWFVLSNGALVGTTEAPATRKKTYYWRFDIAHSCYL